MNILSLDLSLTRTGYAKTIGTGYYFGSIVSKRTGMERIDAIVSEIITLTANVDVVVIEGPALHAQGRGVCERWGLRGVVLYALYQTGVSVVEVPPTVLKKYATGKGTAHKDSVLSAAIRKFGYSGESNDEADAWCLLTMADRHYRGCETSNERTACADKVDWPTSGMGDAA